MNTHDLKTLINSVCLPALESVAFNICLLGIYLFISLIVWVLCKEKQYLQLYPSICTSFLLILIMVQGGLEPIPIPREAGYTPDRAQGSFADRAVLYIAC